MRASEWFVCVEPLAASGQELVRRSPRAASRQLQIIAREKVSARHSSQARAWTRVARCHPHVCIIPAHRLARANSSARLVSASNERPDADDTRTHRLITGMDLRAASSAIVERPSSCRRVCAATRPLSLATLMAIDWADISRATAPGARTGPGPKWDKQSCPLLAWQRVVARVRTNGKLNEFCN